MSALSSNFTDSAWYKLSVPHFQDSDGDGIGDLGGIIQRVDYLAQLGITTLVLSPIFAANLREGEFEVRDFTELEPRFGKLEDLANLADQLRTHDIKLVIEYCPAYTSDQHPWFIQERQGRYSTASDLYLWQATSDGSVDWAWDDVRESYYRCHGHRARPALNVSSPRLECHWRIVRDHWSKYGVHGMSSIQDGAIMVASDAVVPFRLSVSSDMSGEAMRTLIDESSRIDANGGAHILLAEDNGSSKHAAFAYDKSRLLKLIQLMLRGLPLIQQAGELGYNESLTIMPWSSGNQAGFTNGVAWLPVDSDAYHYNVQLQYADPESTLSLTTHLLQLRKFSPALRHGDYHSIEMPDRDVFAFVRETELQRFFVVANLSNRKKNIQVSSRAGSWIAGTHTVMGDGMPPGAKPISLAAFEGRIYEANRSHRTPSSNRFVGESTTT